MPFVTTEREKPRLRGNEPGKMKVRNNPQEEGPTPRTLFRASVKNISVLYVFVTACKQRIPLPAGGEAQQALVEIAALSL